jgi:hypothetical protein
VPFCAFLWQILLRASLKTHTGAGGRPAFDEIIMFKALVLQQLYELSDDQVEFQIRDRLSFMRFPGVHSFADIPDSKTIWLFRENLLKKSGRKTDRSFFNLLVYGTNIKVIYTHMDYILSIIIMLNNCFKSN